MTNPIDIAADIVGSQAELARKLGVTRGRVNQWKQGEGPIPILHCLAIERITDGRVSRVALRPADWQDYWPELAEAGQGA